MASFRTLGFVGSLAVLAGFGAAVPSASAQDIEIVGEPMGEFVVELSDMEFAFEGGFEGVRKRERQRLQPVTAEELERYNRRLGLDTAQSVFTMELFAEFQVRLTELNGSEQALDQAFMERFSKGRGDREAQRPDPEEMRRIIEENEAKRAEIRAQRVALADAFFEDYKLILTPAQLEEWPAIERMRRRDRELAPGTFPGEEIDLIALCEQMELGFNPERVSEAGEAALDEVLGRYEHEVDRLLVARLEVGARHPLSTGADRGAFAIEIDGEAMEDWESEHREAAQRLQRAQQKYARQIAELLDETSRAAFEEEVMRLSYPRVLAESGVDRQFEAILALEDLDDEQKAEMERMASEYAKARARLDHAWMNAIDAEFADGGGSSPMPAGNVQIFIAGGGSESDVAKARAARRAFDREWIDRVRGVLRPEQAERVPAPRRPRGAFVTTFSDFDPETGEESEVITIEIDESESSGGN